MAIIYLIRHGETPCNVEGRIQGQLDSPLNSNGKVQAHRVAQALTGVPLRAIFSSDLARANETADIIAETHHLSPRLDTRLREASYGEWEGLTIAQITQDWPNETAAWRADSLHNRPPNGETLEQLQSRVGQVIAEIIASVHEDAVAIVGHLGSVRAAIAFALDATPAISRRFRIDNCSLSVLEYANNRFTVHRMNDTCHMRICPPPSDNASIMRMNVP